VYLILFPCKIYVPSGIWTCDAKIRYKPHEGFVVKSHENISVEIILATNGNPGEKFHAPRISK
jgi:hypothetical protein